MVEREAFGRQVVGVIDVDHRVLLASHPARESRGSRRRRRPRVASIRRARAGPRTDSPPTTRAGSLVLQPRRPRRSSRLVTPATAGRPARAAACVNSAIASSAASSLLGRVDDELRAVARACRCPRRCRCSTRPHPRARRSRRWSSHGRRRRRPTRSTSSDPVIAGRATARRAPRGSRGRAPTAAGRRGAPRPSSRASSDESRCCRPCGGSSTRLDG